MHLDAEAQGSTHDADGHSQISGGAHLDGELAEELLHLRVGEFGIVLIHRELSGGDGQIFGVLEYFVENAAPVL